MPLLTPELLFALNLPVAYSAGFGVPLDFSPSARILLDRQPDSVYDAINAFARQALAPHIGTSRTLSNQAQRTQVVSLEQSNLIIRAARVPHARSGAGIILVFETQGAERTRELRQPSALTDYGLTEREWQVAERVAAGLTSPVIARELAVTVHTVRRHTESIFRKLGVKSRSALAWNFATKSAATAVLQLKESRRG